MFYIRFIFYYLQQVLFTSRGPSLLLPLNNAPGGIVDDEGFFSFLLKLNWHHPYTFTSPLQQTLKQNQRASHNCYSVKKTCLNMLRAFEWLLNELLLETEWSEVMLVWWFASIKFIRPFLKFPFLICFFKRFPL